MKKISTDANTATIVNVSTGTYFLKWNAHDKDPQAH